MSFRRLLPLLFAAGLATTGRAAPAAGTVSIAAAANLTYALQALNAAFRSADPQVRVTTSLGASGNLYAQITNGAPFDIFMSADTEYAKRVADAGFGDPATLRTFAVGRLVLWTTRPGLDLTNIAAAVKSPTVTRLAIAQPQTAPFGRAARAVLQKLGVWTAVQPKLVIGENISQTAQFVETGNADAGFVALSLVVSSRLARQGRWTAVPPAWYADEPLNQACILTHHGEANAAARAYLEFLKSDAARKILHRFGYAVPGDKLKS